VPALCPQCERVAWGERPRCVSCDLLLLPRSAQQLLGELEAGEHLGQRVDRALLTYEVGDIDRAIADIRDILERWPASGRAHLSMGLALAAKNDLLAGMRCVSRAVRLDPARLSPPQSPAEIMAVRTAIARRDQLDTEGLSPENGLELGQYRAMTGDYSGALDAYTDALTKNQRDPELLTAIGVALRVLGKASEAVELHRRALDVRPDFALGFNNLTSAYADLHDVEAARTCAASAVELQPDLGHANVSLGFALLDAGDTEGAFVALQDAEQRTRSLRPHVAALLAVALLMDDRAEEALAEALDGLEHRFAHRVPQLCLVHAATLEALGDERGAMAAREPLWLMATQPVPDTPELPDTH
jgi:tetratricopeptide (TPR) repeat protein